MKKLNNKGMSIIEIILTFVIIILITSGLLVIIVNYRNKAAVSIERLTLDTFKNTLTQDIYADILNKGLESMEYLNDEECNNFRDDLDLNTCILIKFQDNTRSLFATSKITPNDKDAIQNKYMFYGDYDNKEDGLKYKIKDFLPKNLPSGRTWLELASIKVFDSGALKKVSHVLDNGNKIDIYSIDIEVSHIDFKEDFGIHIVATTDNISL